MRRTLLFSLLFILPAVAAAQRNLTVTGENRVALVIGNSAYKDSPLANPVNDATDVAAALQKFGFRVILSRDVGTREMRQAIREFGTELRRAQVGLFYFAGHGVQVRGENYLVPVGADIASEAEAEDLAINANLALRTMEDAQVGVSIVILDACRNNPFSRGFRSASRGLAQMSAASGSVIAFATAPGSVAADGTGRNGTYTKHLLASLNQPDTDIMKVLQRTRSGVFKETGGKQTPWESTSLIGDFYFHPSGAATQVALVAPATAIATPAVTPGATFRDCDVCPEMVTIPAGSFTMGSPASEPMRDGDEGPLHHVTIAQPFAAGKYEVTFDEWDACARERGCGSRGDMGWGRGRRPVMDVSWDHAKEYVAWLSRKTGKRYRLLTEAEWEYVARAGTTTAFSFGNSVTPERANYDASVSYAGGTTGTKQGKTVEVGRYPPNAFGVHDVHGNVYEWVEDCWNRSYAGAPSDGSAWTSGDCMQRVHRGGSWLRGPQDMRSANRAARPTSFRGEALGFRVARTN